MAIVGTPYKILTKMMAALVLGLCWFSVPAASGGLRTAPREVRALRATRRSLIDPHGNLSNWARGDPCTSNWTGITCYNTTIDDGFLHVREILLYTRNLSGSLSPALEHLSYLKILDFMWNNISGSIPKEIGNIASLELLLLNGNQLTGSLPEELGKLSNMDRIQVDQNHISGSIPASFANLTSTRHFHMNNNSLSGQIPPELSRLPKLVHLLLDNNNLSGYIPPGLAEMPIIQIIQLDNNNFGGTIIPSQFGNISSLLKLSLRNCSLRGPIPDLSNNTFIAYIDLSHNQLEGNLPAGSLSPNITTIDLSNNNLTGMIPPSFSGLPHLQKLSLANNSMSGPIPSTIWQNRAMSSNHSLILDFRFNRFSSITGNLPVQGHIRLGLQGNPICSSSILTAVCGPHQEGFRESVNNTNPATCLPQSCPAPYEYAPASPQTACFCAAPLLIGYRLKSPGFSNFAPYISTFVDYVTSSLDMNPYQLEIDSLAWQEGPRLRMHLKFFPAYVNNTVRLFNISEVHRLESWFSGWRFHGNTIFGPYEFLNFTLTEPYRAEFLPSSGINNGALAGVILGTAAGSVAVATFVIIFFMRHMKNRGNSKRRRSTRISMKIDGVKDFTYREMARATQNFDKSTVLGVGGYGTVYKGSLGDGTIVAIKRADPGSFQGEKEFLNEIELLSRLHHRNLVSLVGYCDEEGEQMLIYEFMPNGNLRDYLSGESSKGSLSFGMRVKIALGAARGIFYLHTEANPPIFHRDIKATNILLDSYFVAKVADFGLSRLVPTQGLEDFLPSHVSTVVRGTPGYLDPEYFLTQKLTDKTDIYSLGVVLLELMTGMHPISQGKNIVREVKTAYHSGTLFSVVDEQIGSYPSGCMERFINLALKCCSEEAHARPNAAEVVRELENILMVAADSDSNLSLSLDSDHSRVGSPPSSSTSASLILNQPYPSLEISSSDLVSGVFPTVRPR